MLPSGTTPAGMPTPLSRTVMVSRLCAVLKRICTSRACACFTALWIGGYSEISGPYVIGVSDRPSSKIMLAARRGKQDSKIQGASSPTAQRGTMGPLW
jgi:hypothetical protein